MSKGKKRTKVIRGGVIPFRALTGAKKEKMPAQLVKAFDGGRWLIYVREEPDETFVCAMETWFETPNGQRLNQESLKSPQYQTLQEAQKQFDFVMTQLMLSAGRSMEKNGETELAMTVENVEIIPEEAQP